MNNGEEKKRTGFNSPVLSRRRKLEAGTLQPEINSSINKPLTQSIQDSASKNNIVIEKNSRQLDDSTLENNIVVKKDSRQINDIAAENNIAVEKDSRQINDSTLENNMVVKNDSGQINDSSTSEKTDKDSLVSEKK